MSNPYSDNIIKYYDNDDSTTSSYNPSRYSKMKNVIDDEGDNYVQTYESIKFPPISSDHYYVVESKYKNRLDLVSYKFYGNPLLYWVIAEASNINNPLDIPTGTLLRIPDYQSLYGYKGILA